MYEKRNLPHAFGNKLQWVASLEIIGLIFLQFRKVNIKMMIISKWAGVRIVYLETVLDKMPFCMNLSNLE